MLIDIYFLLVCSGPVYNSQQQLLYWLDYKLFFSLSVFERKIEISAIYKQILSDFKSTMIYANIKYSPTKLSGISPQLFPLTG